MLRYADERYVVDDTIQRARYYAELRDYDSDAASAPSMLRYMLRAMKDDERAKALARYAIALALMMPHIARR